METTPEKNRPTQNRFQDAISTVASSDTSLVLYPRQACGGQIRSGRSNSFHTDAFWPENKASFDKSPLHGWRRGRYHSRTCRAGFDSHSPRIFQPSTQQFPAASQLRWLEPRAPSREHPALISRGREVFASSDTSFVLYSPRGKSVRICSESLKSAPPGSMLPEAQNAGASLAQR